MRLRKKMKRLSLFFFVIVFSYSTLAYTLHDPIVIENLETTADKPYIIEGYEITNPTGPCIQVRHTDHVIIRNNYIHDCGTKISESIQKKIRNGEGDARLAMMSNPDSTGGMNVFDPLTVKISNNKIINNDYGIRITGHDQKIESALINDNTVQSNHRSHFIFVQNSDNVNIYNNYVKDNGLSLFIDNVGLQKAFEKGEDFGDGRMQGILTDSCSQVKIFNNTVINSSSDGIAVVGNDNKLAEDIEIFNNLVMRNGEQGLWIVKARNGKIHHNNVTENTHRIDTTGGSSGIMFEGEVYDFKIFDNDVSYNDAFGIFFIESTDNEVYNNQIHHNGDGAFGWKNIFFYEEYKYADKHDDGITTIRDNNVHQNRIAVFHIWTEIIGKVIVKDNIFDWNGGNPLHYEMYDDFEMKSHQEDWEYNGEQEFFHTSNNDFIREINKFEILTNTIDSQEVTGKLELKGKPEKSEQEDIEDIEDVSEGKEEKEIENNTYENTFEECNYTAEKVYIALFFITLIALIVILILYIKKKRK
ncbi:MAG: right-handed parallel beta-helix repeat-containing protein [Nanoarchaeota archaeon]|nr:right-handed parallel beta-helix repeat-containing protein [Nanoarchaeota archaeon]MBU1632788.1 right-handed parallel beta-helix repeat-containing protein [Nanoarchaeota archaeon]MBU1876713.1 right-handed parallel beta-helix repeat-containing protein [Nanoarchaeota archaeon]